MKTYRGAILGCGRIGNTFSNDSAALGIYSHAEAYATMPRTELVAVCDQDSERLAACGERWNVSARYTSAKVLLEEAAPEIISICTPDETHFELAMMALDERHRALLIEKPLATQLGEARTLIARAQDRNIPIAVNYSRRYATSHVHLRAALGAGILGQIQAVSGYYTKGVIHNGTHWFDLARFLLGEVLRVQGFAPRPTAEADPTPDARLEFASGATGYLHGCDASAFTVFEMDVMGTSGRIRLLDSGHTFESFTVEDSSRYSGYRNLAPSAGIEGGLRDVTLHALEDLVSCLDSNGRTPTCSAADALRALEIALAVRESAKTGEAVSL